MAKEVSIEHMKSCIAFSRKLTILVVILIIRIGFVVVAYVFHVSWTGFPTSIGPSLPPTEQATNLPGGVFAVVGIFGEMDVVY